VILEIAEEIAELIIIIACLYMTVSVYVNRYPTSRFNPLENRRFKTLLLLTLMVTTIKVSRDVIGGKSGLIDSNILLFIHSHIPNSMIWLFEIITVTGSSSFLFPLTTITTIILIYLNKRSEALLIATSVICSAFVIYVIKMLVNRSRPALWDTEWYWGSSFPSGHTLAVTTYATAVILCLIRAKPEARNIGTLIATIWILLVAISRLALGVHWPTDVLVAICIGAFLPIAISSIFRLPNN
jgi:undecaprenyl-diphosphatase